MGDWDILRVFERAQRRRGLRPRTVTERTRTLLRLSEEGPLLDMSTDDIDDWLDRQRISPRSRRAYLSHIHAFYLWAVITGHRIDDPTAPIPPPKVARLLPRPIDGDDLDVALRLADPRMRAWLTLACFAGFRCMEIAQLRREDVLDARTPPLLVVADGKGGKQGTVPMHDDILAALRLYGLPTSGPVFLSNRGTMFSPATISGYVANYLHGLGIPAAAHMLRHWFGTEVYADTHDLRLTQEVMRHSDPSSTAGYVAYDSQDAVAAVTSLATSRSALPSS